MGTSRLMALSFIDKTDIKKRIIKNNTTDFSEYRNDISLKIIAKIKGK